MNERSAEPAIFPPPGERTLVWAHRGYMARAPQNTLAAFTLAWEAGADGIELDAQRSADGHAVVFHDDTLDRLTDGAGAVADRPLEYLRSLDAGSRFSGSFAGERIPLLARITSYNVCYTKLLRPFGVLRVVDEQLRAAAEFHVRLALPAAGVGKTQFVIRQHDEGVAARAGKFIAETAVRMVEGN